MSSEVPKSLLGEYQQQTMQRGIFKKAKLKDYVVFITIFGIFSIFSSYVEITDTSGTIIRDLSPKEMVNRKKDSSHGRWFT
jgi:hypothetical protein